MITSHRPYLSGYWYSRTSSCFWWDWWVRWWAFIKQISHQLSNHRSFELAMRVFDLWKFMRSAQPNDSWKSAKAWLMNVAACLTNANEYFIDLIEYPGPGVNMLAHSKNADFGFLGGSFKLSPNNIGYPTTFPNAFKFVDYRWCSRVISLSLKCSHNKLSERKIN